jgi:hypothetical protein
VSVEQTYLADKKDLFGKRRLFEEAMDMALTVSAVPRNLATKVRFLYLEFEDLFAILALAVVMNVLGRFFQRDMFGVPMNMVLQWVVPILSIPFLILFKYGKPRGYLRDWMFFHMKPHVYCALERDSEQRVEYMKPEEN